MRAENSVLIVNTLHIKIYSSLKSEANVFGAMFVVLGALKESAERSAHLCSEPNRHEAADAADST